MNPILDIRLVPREVKDLLFRSHPASAAIPNLQDRLIQQAIVLILTPIFDPHFSESSFGFRPKRSAHGAANREKSRVRSWDEFEYLGFIFAGSRASLNVSPKALKKFKRRVVTIIREFFS